MEVQDVDALNIRLGLLMIDHIALTILQHLNQQLHRSSVDMPRQLLSRVWWR
jgi:hypothetical protein